MIGIMIVDDNVRLREAIRTELERQGTVRIVGEAADGVAAIQLAQTLRPDVVLMDVNMARLDGVGATRNIRALLPHTVVVGMSSHSRDMVEQALLSAGADLFLPKEMLLQHLLPAVAQLLARRGPPEAKPSQPTASGSEAMLSDATPATLVCPILRPNQDPREPVLANPPLGPTAWTAEVPSGPGWYWLRHAMFHTALGKWHEPRPVIVELVPDQTGQLLVYVTGTTWRRSVADLVVGEWSGPLVMPQ